MSFDPKVIEALAQLRHSAATHTNLPSNVQWAINTLDDAGVFAALDEQTGSARAESILAESAAQSLGTLLGQGLITEPKNTPLDEPLVGRQAEVYGRLLRPGQALTRADVDAMFEDPDSTRLCGCGAVGVHGVDHED